MFAGIAATPRHRTVGRLYVEDVLRDAPLFLGRLGEPGILLDESGNGRHGTYTGTLASAGSLLILDPNPSVDFTSGWGLVPYAAWMNTTAFTFEALINADAVNGYRAVGSRDGVTSRGWNLYVLDGKLHVFDGAGSGGVLTGRTTLAAGTTYHVAMTSTGADVHVYVNGKLDGSATYTLSNTIETPGLAVGMSYAGAGAGNFLFDGRIDEVAYHGAALSPARLASHYNKSRGRVRKSYAEVVLGDSPLAAYHLSADLMIDYTANGRGGSYAGARVPAAGLLTEDPDEALALTANSNAGVGSIASGTWMNPTSLSVECLVRLTSLTDGTNGDAIVSRYAAGGFQWLIWRNTAGALALQVFNAAGATINIASGITTTLGATYHLVYTHDGSTARLFCDGALRGSAACAGRQASSVAIEVGRYSGSANTVPAGVVDELSIYGSALSPQQVATHYTAARAA